MVDALYVTAGIGFFVLFGLVSWLLVIVFRSKKEPEDSPITLNFLSHFDSGNFIGTETTSIGAKDGRHFIKFLPKDVNIKTEEKDIKEVTVIVDRNKIFSFPKGTLSKDRNINVILPKHASDFHEAVKNSEIGKGLMLATELQNAVNAEVGSLLEGHQRKDEILKRIGHAEIPKEYLQFQDELYRDALKFAIDARTRDKQGFTTPFPTVKRD